jgi:hypothetical protein
MGTTSFEPRFAQTGHLPARGIGCPIGNGSGRSARIGDSALGWLLSLALLAIVGLGNQLLHV